MVVSFVVVVVVQSLLRGISILRWMLTVRKSIVDDGV